MAAAMVVKVLLTAVLMVSASQRVAAQVHHVVGGDRGWDPTNDVASWSAGKIFRVRDKIWFCYSVGQGTVIELKSKEEYESCDLTNPIRMYTDGINSISLDEQRIHYFASSNSEHCKKGLKLHIDVMPREAPDSLISVVATGPTPSASGHLAPTLLYHVSLFCLLFSMCFWGGLPSALLL